MRGVTYGRVLAELALVRLSCLEDLNALEQVVAAIRSGQFAIGGTVPGRLINTTQTAQPAAGRAAPLPSATNSTVEKKNDLTSISSEQPSPSLVTSTENSTQPVPPVPPPKIQPTLQTVDLQPGTEVVFLAQLLDQIPLMLKSNLKNAVPSATSGPNLLVLSFEKRYDLARQYCERRDNLDRLREIATQIAGRPITVSLRQAASAPANEGGAPSDTGNVPVKVAKKGTGDEPKVKPDPFVLRAAEIFHGRVGDATQLS
jgi:DNA polymerase-3 subunit gamma/tau